MGQKLYIVFASIHSCLIVHLNFFGYFITITAAGVIQRKLYNKKQKLNPKDISDKILRVYTVIRFLCLLISLAIVSILGISKIELLILITQTSFVLLEFLLFITENCNQSIEFCYLINYFTMVLYFNFIFMCLCFECDESVLV